MGNKYLFIFYIHLFSIFLLFGLIPKIKAQSSANYTFTNATSGTLTTMTGSTQLIGSDLDDDISSLTNIGFNFIFMGNIYSQFSVNSNGIIALGGTLLSSSLYNVSTGTTAMPLISAFSGDLRTSSTGKVHYLRTGTAPNRVLTIEFNRMTLLYLASPGANNGTYQVRLYETSGVIEFLYNGMVRNTGTGDSFSQQVGIGFSVGTSANQYARILSASNNNATTGGFTFQTYASGNITNLNTTGRIYTYTPIAAPSTPTGLNFTSVGSNVMTLNWTDVATTELNYLIYRSDDGGTTYNLITTLPANSTSYTATGLTPSTNYFWQVVAINEGKTSNNLQGSQATTAPPSISGTIYVSPTDTYTSLTRAGGIFQQINGSQLTGNITIIIRGNLTEDGTNALNQWLESPASSNYTITIQSDGTTRVISGTTVATNAPMININGADRVTINGGSKNLIFRNTNATPANTGATLQFQNTSVNCTVQNCIFENNSTSTSIGTINFPNATTNTNNVTIQGNEIRNATAGTIGRPNLGIVCVSPNTTLNIDNNQVYDFNSTGIRIGNANNGLNISNNHLFSTTSTSSVIIGIDVSTGSTSSGHTINNNFIGGNATNATGTWTHTGNNTFTAIYVDAGSTTTNTINNNTIQNFTFSGASVTGFRGIYLASNTASTISGLNVKNLNFSSMSSNSPTIVGVWVASSPNTTIQNSTFNNWIYSGTGSSGYMTATYMASANVVNIIGNTISNFSSATSRTASLSSTGLAGVYTDSGCETLDISQNIIFNINATHATARTSVYGIFLNASVTATINRNKIYNLTNISTNGSAIIGGMYAWYGTFVASNNQITITNDTNTNPVVIYGIWEATLSSASGTQYYNTIYIGGSANTGTSNSYAYLRDSFASTIVLRNNAYINARTNTGTASGKHYTLGSINTTLASGWSATASNYNFLANSQPANFATWSSNSTPTDETFATWKTKTGGDGNSWNVVTTTSGASNASTLNVNNLFIHLPSGNLNVDINNAECWFLNGKGIQIPSISADYSNASAGRSTTLLTGGTDIGAHHFKPNVMPIAAAVTGTIGAGNTQTFTFAGRTVFSLTWNAGGTLPTSLGTGLEYHSGEWPLNPNTGAEYINAYWRLNPVGGSGFSYTASLYYDPALFGMIAPASETAMRLSKKPTSLPYVYPTAYLWYTYINTGSATNTTTKTVNAVLNLTSFSDFTASNDSRPLPLTLLDFQAKRENTTDIQLYWNTSQETSIKSIIVEKSKTGNDFEDIQILDAKNSRENSYFTKDIEINSAYYRLKFIGTDGREDYSMVRFVKGNESTWAFVAPNPVSENSYLEASEDIKNAKNILINITNVSGQHIANFEGNWEKIHQTLKNEINHWTKGCYILNLKSDNNKKLTLKLIK